MRYLLVVCFALVCSCVIGAGEDRRGKTGAGSSKAGSGGSDEESGGSGGNASVPDSGSSGSGSASDSGSSGSDGTAGDGSAGDGSAGDGSAGDGSSGSGGDASGDDGDSGTSGGSGGDGAGDGGSAGSPEPDDDGGEAGPLDGCTYDAIESHGGHDYYFCSNYATWTDAREVCAGGAASLVQIDDAGENDFLLGNFGVSPFWWIGANDEAADGEWRWADGSSSTGTHFCTVLVDCAPEGGRYVNFAFGEPSGFPTENCGAMTSDGTWQDEYCTTVKPFVCELE